MVSQLGIIWDERFCNVDFGPDHPVSGERYKQTFILLEKLGVLKENVKVFDAEPATEGDLQLVHEPDYISKIKKMSETGIGELSKDTPAFRGMHEYGCVSVGGTLTGAKKSAIKYFHPFVSMAGGYHHAFPNKGGGFNIYNDVAITTKWFLEHEIFERIAIVDTDVHHGNGTQAIFYQDPNVLTISLHETGKSLYPGTGFITEIGEKAGKGYCINFPFEPGSASSDIELVWAFRKIVPRALRRFQPDFVIWQAGVDSHIDDPLANLRFTTRGFQEIAQLFREAINEITKGKALVVAGGGYNIQSAIWSYASIIATLVEKRIYIPEEVDQNRYASPNAVPRPYIFKQIRFLEKNIPLLQ
jgi:acetoin utilization protein AcuC